MIQQVGAITALTVRKAEKLHDTCTGADKYMRHKVKTCFCGIIILLLLPLVVTILFQGEAFFPNITARKQVTETEMLSDIGWDSEEIEGKVTAILAKEISVNSEKEAIKAQAIVIRTNLIGARLTGGEEPEGLTTDQMMQQFGEDAFRKCYERLAECVKETEGLVMTCRNKLIEAPYFAVSAGRTRSAADAFDGEAVAYLKAVESKEDIESEEFLRVEFREIDEFVESCNSAFENASLTAEDIASQIEVISRDESEYVKELRLGQVTVDGEEFRKALNLHSACFTIKEVEGQIRIVTKGYGHGVGLSQYGANCLAGEGKGYEEILKKYFADIKIIKYK